MQTLEQFVEERYRNTGKGRTLASFMLSVPVIDPNKPLAVFSTTTADIARKLNVTDVVLFERRGTDWVEV
jgi:hypothetical protein